MSGKKRVNIPNCEYWGEFNGYTIYRCYDKVAPKNYSGIIFAVNNKLFMNGIVIGNVSESGTVTNWHPEKAEVKEEEEVKPVVKSKDIDQILSDSWKRSVEDLVGQRLADMNKTDKM